MQPPSPPFACVCSPRRLFADPLVSLSWVMIDQRIDVWGCETFILIHSRSLIQYHGNHFNNTLRRFAQHGFENITGIHSTVALVGSITCHGMYSSYSLTMDSSKRGATIFWGIFFTEYWMRYQSELSVRCDSSNDILFNVKYRQYPHRGSPCH